MSTSSLSKENLKKVAVIGCGVGGLGAAWLVNRHPNYHVTLYEKETRLGGHANTVIVSTN
jgi:predicted NAD/FAD-binding protein